LNRFPARCFRFWEARKISPAPRTATRLRLVLVDDALADQQAIGKIEGVKGCFRNAGQMQIILAPGW
jgi:PTS system sucrose-specific IIC component